MNHVITRVINDSSPYVTQIHNTVSYALGKAWSMAAPHADKVADFVAPYWTQAGEMAAPYWIQICEFSAPYLAKVSPFMAQFVTLSTPVIAKISTVFAQHVAAQQWMSAYCTAVACEASIKGVYHLAKAISLYMVGFVWQKARDNSYEAGLEFCLDVPYVTSFALGAVNPLLSNIVPIVSSTVDAIALRQAIDEDRKANPANMSSQSSKNLAAYKAQALRRTMASERYMTAYVAQRGAEHICRVAGDLIGKVPGTNATHATFAIGFVATCLNLRFS